MLKLIPINCLHLFSFSTHYQLSFKQPMFLRVYFFNVSIKYRLISTKYQSILTPTRFPRIKEYGSLTENVIYAELRTDSKFGAISKLIIYFDYSQSCEAHENLHILQKLFLKPYS